jgi:hypothetical protein
LTPSIRYGNSFQFVKSFVRLQLMRRNSYIWALGAFLVATVLGLSGGSSQSVETEKNSASSPLSKAHVESAALCELLVTQFHGCTRALLPKPVSLEFRSSRIGRLADSIDVSSELLYSPIQRRPPPKLS